MTNIKLFNKNILTIIVSAVTFFGTTTALTSKAYSAPQRTGRIVHTVQSGETLGIIASKYKINLNSLMSANGIKNANIINAGQKLIIPSGYTKANGRSLSVGTNDIRSGRFAWPATGGVLSSSFGFRNGKLHKGIDIAAPIGTTIKSVQAGKVIFSGWGGAYGNLIKVQHANGLVTKYAHCSKIYVRTGQSVGVGQSIGAIGNTGRSTGPHLHFETVLNGQNVNPKSFL